MWNMDGCNVSSRRNQMNNKKQYLNLRKTEEQIKFWMKIQF